MKIPIYQVDAFAQKVMTGNPAAVCPLSFWLEDDILQSIAAENNLSETAFFVSSNPGFDLRWFTPTTEVDLCGHATLATAHVIFSHLNYAEEVIQFETKSGILKVTRHPDRLELDFPILVPKLCDLPDQLSLALGQTPIEVLAATDYIALFDRELVIKNIQPDFAILSKLDLRGVIITAPGDNVDFVSRFFAPKFGIPEDPVTGSAHCALAPYWGKRLQKTLLQARQISDRGGNIECELNHDRVFLRGAAMTYLVGEIMI